MGDTSICASYFVGAILFPGVLNLHFPDVYVSFVYARILWFSVAYEIFNENFLIKCKRGYYKQRERSKENISSVCQKINLLFSEY